MRDSLRCRGRGSVPAPFPAACQAGWRFCPLGVADVGELGPGLLELLLNEVQLLEGLAFGLGCPSLAAPRVVAVVDVSELVQVVVGAGVEEQHPEL